MKHRAFLAVGIAAVSVFAAPVRAQPFFFKYSLKWEEPNLVTGEVKGSVNIEITPEFGSTVTWTMGAHGKGQPGTLKAFASSILDLANILNGTKGTLAWTVPSEFTGNGLPGTPNGNGGITGSNAGQAGFPFNPEPNIDNPVKVLDLLWKLNDPAFVGTVDYQVSPKSGKAFIDIGVSQWVAGAAELSGSSASFEIPAGSTLAAFGFGLAVLTQRRRERVVPAPGTPARR